MRPSAWLHPANDRRIWSGAFRLPSPVWCRVETVSLVRCVVGSRHEEGANAFSGLTPWTHEIATHYLHVALPDRVLAIDRVTLPDQSDTASGPLGCRLNPSASQTSRADQ